MNLKKKKKTIKLQKFKTIVYGFSRVIYLSINGTDFDFMLGNNQEIIYRPGLTFYTENIFILKGNPPINPHIEWKIYASNNK